VKRGGYLGLEDILLEVEVVVANHVSGIFIRASDVLGTTITRSDATTNFFGALPYNLSEMTSATRETGAVVVVVLDFVVPSSNGRSNVLVAHGQVFTIGSTAVLHLTGFGDLLGVLFQSFAVYELGCMMLSTEFVVSSKNALSGGTIKSFSRLQQCKNNNEDCTAVLEKARHVL
jgi:hypothetical protein